ncbi:piggyBac transposable element-derived protein 4-like [Procambarus clarkii]|uniref:piggyBac transposable element-derived protein 4-like n=1 Tax=Procambarus clarkii TaxID=6728 RepID=UPI0037440489
MDMILHSRTYFDIPSQDPHGFSDNVVKTLMDPMLNKGHILYTDNYYTSLLLTRILLDHTTGVCGTVKTHRRKMPVFGIGIAVGKCQLRKCDQMLSVLWRDRHEVNMLITIHTGAMLESGKVNFATKVPMNKPDWVINHNVNMRLVYKCAMMVGAVKCVQKYVK